MTKSRKLAEEQDNTKP